MGEKEFLERFVVRTEIFEEVFDDLLKADYSVPNQHYIIIGQRGQGKTTLLRKIQIEVQKNKELSKFLLPVKFTEEQYQIRSLCRLWEEVADYLQTIYEDEFEDVLDGMEEHFEDDDYDLMCFSYLEAQVKSKEKKLLLLIDNIDELLGKLKEKEQKQLREILLSSSTFRIIGASTKMLEQQYDYGKPFYQFFKIIRLKGLSQQESIEFLRVIGQGKQRERIEHIIKHSPERIETLRQLTGGVPRTLVMLFDIFVDDDGNAFEDLLKVLGEVTPLYKDRMDSLPPALQDIVHTIAMNWDGILTKEIAKKTRMDSKTVSAQLKQLEKYQIITFESIGKNKIYKIQERFFNIWYLMRFGRKKDRQRVEWLVKFLVSWYSQDELKERANKLIDSMKIGNVKEDYAYHMSEALSYAGLDMETELYLKKDVTRYLRDLNSTYVREVSDSDYHIIHKATSLIDDNCVNEAIQLLEKSQKSGKQIVFYLALLYHLQKKYELAKKYYFEAINKGEVRALKLLGNLYNDIGLDHQAEKYYLEAITNGDDSASIRLAALYTELKHYALAEEHYFKAIDYGDKNAYRGLGTLFYYQGKYDLTEKYYLKAIENNDYNAMNLLAWFYFMLDKNSNDALKLAQMAYENNKSSSNTLTLAIIELWTENFSKSYERFLEWLPFEIEHLEYESGIMNYFSLLISKGQYYQAKKFLEMSEYQLKERFKPIWYALMTLMQDEFPNEIKKMGSELQESVDAILKEIEGCKIKYSI